MARYEQNVFRNSDLRNPRDVHATLGEPIIPSHKRSSSLDANGNAITRNGYTVGWTSYNYPSAIAASGESVSFSYGPDRKRWQQSYNSGAEITDYVGGLLEVVGSGGVTSYRHYVYAGAEPVAVYSRTTTAAINWNYFVQDQLGSVAAITNSSGAVNVNENFTAYGARRNPSTWSGPPTSGDLNTIAGLSRQGYTFQTALGQSMGLNHMNGRVQDAITGRFISGDPTIPDPSNAQSYNRYSYVVNNPLSQIDPSGFDPACLGDNGGQECGDIINALNSLNAQLDDFEKGVDTEVANALMEEVDIIAKVEDMFLGAVSFFNSSAQGGGGGGTQPKPPGQAKPLSGNPPPTQPTSCPNGGEPSRASNPQVGRNIGYGMIIGGTLVATGAVVVFVSIVGFPEAEIAAGAAAASAEAAGGAAGAAGATVGFSNLLGRLSALSDPALVGLSAGAHGAAGGAAVGLAATTSTCP